MTDCEKQQVILLTSRYWEGAYVLKEFIDQGVPCNQVVVQKTWWRNENDYDYSDNYLKKLAEDSNVQFGQTYYSIEELAEKHGIGIKRINSVNSNVFFSFLKDVDPSIIAVVGSKIIKPDIVNRFKGKFVNYHTGILPEFRGPYSEFWAIYEGVPEYVGTTIHLIDEGIDTGNILKQVFVDVGQEKDPQLAHIINAKAGARLMASTINDYLIGNVIPREQDEERAKYFTFPTDEQIADLGIKLGIKIDLRYAD